MARLNHNCSDLNARGGHRSAAPTTPLTQTEEWGKIAWLKSKQ